MKLSERAKDLLILINEFTDRNWETGEILRYFIPNNEKWSDVLDRHILVSGAGDARILKSLEGKGLIERPPRASSLTHYVYAITEDGLLAVEGPEGIILERRDQ